MTTRTTEEQSRLLTVRARQAALIVGGLGAVTAAGLTVRPDECEAAQAFLDEVADLSADLHAALHGEKGA
jgi:hypothetical protein